MVEMTHSPSTFKLGLAYNAFLFASLGDGPGGTPINLASALARLGLDPWREAAELAHLSSSAAVGRLSQHLIRLAPDAAQAADATVLAATLVGLLPQGAEAVVASQSFKPGVGLGLRIAIVIAAGVFALSGLAIGIDAFEARRPTLTPQASAQALAPSPQPGPKSEPRPDPPR